MSRATPNDDAPDTDDGTEADAEALEYGRWLFAQPVEFVIGAAGPGQLPETALPEVAFAGRSNVGKSSLINALVGQNALARTSNTPGRTRQINFFELAGRLMLADLPGYGYAKAPKGEVRQWTRLVMDYLAGRPTLRRACLLIDARHGFKDSDRDVMAMLDKAAVVYQVVLTKADKLKAAELGRRIADVGAETATHTAAHPDIVATSASDGIGIAELRAALAALAPPGRDA